MSDKYSCEQVREIAAEVALGIAPARERARALDHLVSCSDCRSYVQELSSVADEVLLLAPESEPPIGFESRVIDSFEATASKKGMSRILLAAAALIVAAAIAAGGTYLAGGHSRALASRWASAVDGDNDSSFATSALTNPSSRFKAGHAFLLRGSPSWVYVEVEAPSSFSGTYGVQLVTTSGKVVPVGSVTYKEGRGSWGRAVDEPGSAITGLQCTDENGKVVLTADFPVTNE
ncbi:MAG: zf-HC2 domain-containing protein [Actinomycetota bacterium]|nr:zf-HC2 domain-containing protein [Actinomycetota bacterium]